MELCEGGCGTLVDVRAGQYLCGGCDIDPDTLAILESETFELDAYDAQERYEEALYDIRQYVEAHADDY